MEILKITDNPDGSANVEFEMTREEQEILINYAVVDILSKQIEKEKNPDSLD